MHICNITNRNFFKFNAIKKCIINRLSSNYFGQCVSFDCIDQISNTFTTTANDIFAVTVHCVISFANIIKSQ